MEKFKSVTSFLPRGFDHFCGAEPLGYFTGLAWAGNPPPSQGEGSLQGGPSIPGFTAILLNNSDVFAPQITSLKLFFVFTALIKFPLFFASSMISIFFRAPITLPFIEASSIFFLHYWRCDRFPQLFVVCWRLHVWPWWSLHGQVWFEHFATKRPVLIKMSLSSDDHFSLHDSNIWTRPSKECKSLILIMILGFFMF